MSARSVRRLDDFRRLRPVTLPPLSRRRGPRPSPPPRPNIVWISNEDMSPHLGVYGDALARTPTLDRLATQSVRFTRAFTTAPVCAPSRAAIITGMYQTSIGAQHMRTTEDRVPELPGPVPGGAAVLRQGVSRIPARGRLLHQQPRQDRLPVRRRRSRSGTISADQAHWRNRADKSQPFFSVFNLEITHESQIFPSSPARKGKPLVTDPAKIKVPPYYPDTPGRPRRARAHVRQHRRHGRPGRARSSGSSRRTAWPTTPSCSTGAITATACRAPSARSTTRACACR